MSEPFVAKLSRFTPDARGLDRDALLFAAGRRSARPSRWWKRLAAALAVAQVLTLVLLWPPTAPPVSAPPAPSPALPETVEPSTASPPGEAELLVLSRRLLQEPEGGPTPVRAGESLVPDAPPLRAFAVRPASFVE